VRKNIHLFDKLGPVRKSFCLRVVLAMGMLLLAGPSRVFAEEAMEQPPFAIPPRLGTITDYYQPKAMPGTPARLQRPQLVVLIQDLHANVGVQKNIASILYRLLHYNKGYLLVCVEGASGEGDVSLLRSLPGAVRHAFEAMLLHRAYLTGAELAATEAAAEWAQQGVVIWSRIKAFFVQPINPLPVSLTPIHLWGVDDPELYRKNWRAAKTVDRLHNQALDYIHSTREFLAGGASPVLQKQLSLVTKALLLRLQPQEYADYLKGRSLNPHGPPVYEQTLQAAETYYAAANRRSAAMTHNLLQKVGRMPGLTALVTGGFHTQEISGELKRRQLAYLVITPRVEVLDQDQAYRARLREEE
jgi:hypothetical protein